MTNAKEMELARKIMEEWGGVFCKEPEHIEGTAELISAHTREAVEEACKPLVEALETARGFVLGYNHGKTNPVTALIDNALATYNRTKGE